MTIDTRGIVWLEPIDHLDYVRVSTRRKYGFQEQSQGERLVGYDPTPGEFRTVFLLRPSDRDSSPDGIYANICPPEAVDPRTLSPGKPGEKTPRCFGAVVETAVTTP